MRPPPLFQLFRGFLPSPAREPFAFLSVQRALGPILCLPFLPLSFPSLSFPPFAATYINVHTPPRLSFVLSLLSPLLSPALPIPIPPFVISSFLPRASSLRYVRHFLPLVFAPSSITRLNDRYSRLPRLYTFDHLPAL